MHRLLASPLGSLGSLAPGLALVALLALAPGCKSMGGVMSGLGKVAEGAARAAPAVARGAAHAGGAIARGVARTAPDVLRATETVTEAVTEAVIETAAEVALSTPTEIEIDLGHAGEVPLSSRPPDDDPCQACSLDDCGVCVGYAGYACVASPAGALSHCESSAPPDAPPASAPSAAPSSSPPAIPASGAAPG